MQPEPEDGDFVELMLLYYLGIWRTYRRKCLNLIPGQSLIPEIQKYVAVVLPTQTRLVFWSALKNLRVYELCEIVKKKNAFRK
jgi:hypothetical protein